MPKKQHRGKSAQIKELANGLINNGAAYTEERQKKHWTIHDLKRIFPKTENQELAFKAFINFDHVALDGSAGSGKSLIAFYHGLDAVISKAQDRIIIVRSAVPVRDQGFIKGEIEEKNAVYEAPYHSLCYELLGKKTSYVDLKKAGLVEFNTTGYLRGVTLDNCIIIIEEAQNMTSQELRTVITRTGQNSRVFITADNKQKDLKQSDYERALKIIRRVDSFALVTFGHDDILRSKLVKQWLIAEEEV